jgi:PIN domain nuclease of toxin-antitoxin system
MIAQAQIEGLTIMTVDPVFRAYRVPVLDSST